MKKMLYIAGLSLVLGNMSPVQAMEIIEADPVEPVAEEMTEAQVLGQQFLKTASEMWFLLSGISSRDEADQAAPRFQQLVRETFELDNKLSSLPMGASAAECVGMMDAVQLRILETMDDLHVEFLSLCRAQCYGSEQLSSAFTEAVQLGMFAEADMEMLEEPGEPFTEEESRLEIVRLKRLLEPDRAVLLVLADVQNETSAAEATTKLVLLSQRFKTLLPEEQLHNRYFSPACMVAAQEVMAPIEPVLWAIRSEIVRIAALPGYEAETFDDFSNALDNVFECLAATHQTLFDAVFDASFRTDLDNALRENAISTQ